MLRRPCVGIGTLIKRCVTEYAVIRSAVIRITRCGIAVGIHADIPLGCRCGLIRGLGRDVEIVCRLYRLNVSESGRCIFHVGNKPPLVRLAVDVDP